MPATPLSYGQQALWVIYREAPDSAAYNMALPLRFTGAVDAAILRWAVRRVLDRHPMLRSVFGESDGVPHQRPQAEISHYWLEVDASQWVEEELMAQVHRFSQQPFVLEECAFRATLFQGAEAGAVFLVTLHHIAGDATSLAILGKQVLALYAAEADGQAVNLPTLETDYADYVQWEASLVNGDKGRRMAAYWQQQLAGEAPILQLPTDHPRPPLQTYNGASLFIELPEELTQAIKDLAKAHHSTLFAVLLSAYQVLLHRHSGQPDIWVCIPTSTPRNQPEFSELVGYLVNPMILRAGFSVGDIGFNQLMQQNNRQMLTGLYHQPYPFTQLIEQLQPQRNPAYPPLVQAMFALERDDLIPRVFSANHHHAIRLDMAQMDGQFDLALTFSAGGDGKALLGKWGYNRDLFDADTVERMSGNFEMLLRHITEDPQQPIGRLPMLTEGEVQQLQAWNDTATDYPQDQTLVDLFEAQVERTPDNIAVVFEDDSLTYRQLNAKANRLAHHLLSLAKPDGQPFLTSNPLIAIAVERSLDMVIGLLAILKAGGAYVPIDPGYPAARIRYMLDDSQAPLLLTQSHLTGPLSLADLEHDCVVLCLDQTDVAGQSCANLTARSMTEDLAYVIYTSGSTGMPKGVMIAHQALVNHMIWMQNVFAFTPEDKILQKTPFSFDASVWEFYAPLLNGGTMVLLKPEGHTDINLLFASLTQNQITVLQLVPTLLKAMLELNETIPPRLRYLFCGGEAITQELVLSFDSRASHTNFYNLYGPTEACIDASFWECKSSATVSIGQPIANTRIYILNAQHQPQPPGIPGELCIAGAGLARGYLNRPELTAEKFIEVELFGNTERTYKTGDLARWLPDGNLEFLGRIDHQIKLRGFRIELGEIEAAISQYEGVKESVVSLYEAYGNQRLVAYIVAGSSDQWSVASGQCLVVSEKQAEPDVQRNSPSLATALATFLKSRLPDYMVPAQFVMLDKLPLTPNGKVDRKALPEPQGQANPCQYEPPQTPTEELLASIWAGLLRLERVGRQDNFFELGGHSLLATQVASRLRGEISQPVPIRALFEHPSLASLAAWLEDLRDETEQETEEMETGEI